MPCVNHPGVEEVVLCHRCGGPFCGSCVVEFRGRTLCGTCKNAAVRELERGAGADDDPNRPGLPLEDLQGRNWLSAAVATTGRVLFAPDRAFREMRLSGLLGRAIGYQVATYALAAALNFVYMMLLVGGMSALPGARVGAGDLGLQFASQAIFGVLSPLISIVYLLLFTALVHVVLLCLGRARGGFDLTLKCAAYCQGAGFVFAVIPLFGQHIGVVWGLVCLVFALLRAQRAGVAASIVAALSPILLCCLACGGIVAAVMITAAASGR